MRSDSGLGRVPRLHVFAMVALIMVLAQSQAAKLGADVALRPVPGVRAAPRCSQDSVVLGGNITFLANGGSVYGNRMNCSWIVSPSPPNDLIVLNFTVFNTEANYDFVQVYGPTGALVWSASGYIRGSTVVAAPGPTVVVRFISDASAAPPNGGFACDIQSVSRVFPSSAPSLAPDDETTVTLSAPQWQAAWTVDVPGVAIEGVLVTLDTPPPRSYAEYTRQCEGDTLLVVVASSVDPASNATVRVYANDDEERGRYQLLLPPTGGGTAATMRWQVLAFEYGVVLSLDSELRVATSTHPSSVHPSCPKGQLVDAPAGVVHVETTPRCTGGQCTWQFVVAGAARIALNASNLPSNYYGLYFQDVDQSTSQFVSMTSRGSATMLATWGASMTLMSQPSRLIFGADHAVRVEYVATVLGTAAAAVPVWPPTVDATDAELAVNLTFPAYSHTFKVPLSQRDVGRTLFVVYTTKACMPGSDGRFHVCDSRLFAGSSVNTTLETAIAGNWDETFGPIVQQTQQHMEVEVTANLAAQGFVFVSLWGGRSGHAVEPYDIFLTRSSRALSECHAAGRDADVIRLDPDAEPVVFVSRPVLVSRCNWAFEAPPGRRIAVSATPLDANSRVGLQDGLGEGSFGAGTTTMVLFEEYTGSPPEVPVRATTSKNTLLVTLATDAISFRSGLRLEVSVLPEPRAVASLSHGHTLELDVAKNDTGSTLVQYPESAARVTVWSSAPDDNATTLQLSTDMFSSYGALYYAFGGANRSNGVTEFDHTAVSRGMTPVLAVPTRQGYHHFLYQHFRAYTPGGPPSQRVEMTVSQEAATPAMALWSSEAVHVLSPCQAVVLPLAVPRSASTTSTYRGVQTKFRVPAASLHPAASGVAFVAATGAWSTRVYGHLGAPFTAVDSDAGFDDVGQWDAVGSMNFYLVTQGRNVYIGESTVLGAVHSVDAYGAIASRYYGPQPGVTANVVAVPVFRAPPVVDWRTSTAAQPHTQCVCEALGMSVFKVCPPTAPWSLKLTFVTSSSDRTSAYLKAGAVPTLATYDEAIALLPHGATEIMAPPVPQAGGGGASHDGASCLDAEAVFVGIVDMQDAIIPGQKIDPNRKAAEPGVAVRVVFEAIAPPRRQPPPANPDGGAQALPGWAAGIIAVFAVATVGLSVMLAQTWRRWKTAQGQAARGALVVDGVELGRVRYGNLDDASQSIPAGADADVGAGAGAGDGAGDADDDGDDDDDLAVLRALRRSHPDIVAAAAASLRTRAEESENDDATAQARV